MITAQTVSIIPKFGASISHAYLPESTVNVGPGIVSTREESKNAATGITGGVAVNIKVSKIFSFQPELLYIQKGFTTISSSGSSSSFDYSQKISYLEIPLLAKANYNIGKLQLHVIAGPSVAFALGGNYNYTIHEHGLEFSESGTIYFKNQPSGYNGNNQYYTKSAYNRVDLGLQLGGGIGYKVGPGTLILDARYGIGFINFERKQTNNTNNGINYFYYNNTSQFRALAITLGYAIPINKKSRS